MVLDHSPIGVLRSSALCVALALSACGGPTTDTTTTPDPEPVVETPPEPEPLVEEAPPEPAVEEAPPEPPVSMDPVATGDEVSLACGRVLFSLPEGGTVENDDEGCGLSYNNVGSGWVGAEGSARFVVGECDLYVSVREDVPAELLAEGDDPSMRDDTFLHPSGASLRIVGRDGHVYARGEGGTQLHIEVGADRDACMATMGSTLVAAAQTLHTPGLRGPEGAAVLPLGSDGAMGHITIPEGFFIEYTGEASHEYETSWRIRPVGEGPYVRLFSYRLGRSYEVQGDELLRAAAFGRTRTFTLSGGDFVEQENRGLAAAQSRNRRTEVLISIPEAESEPRTAILEALATSRLR